MYLNKEESSQVGHCVRTTTHVATRKFEVGTKIPMKASINAKDSNN